MSRKSVIIILVLLFGIFNFTLLATEAVQGEESPQYGLAVGDSAPDFEAVSYTGKKIRLSDIYKNNPVVLIFYRGLWCPFCNHHLQKFQFQISDFHEVNAKIIAVSVDKPEFSRGIAEKNSLDFDVISDPDAGLLEAYKVIYHVPAELAEKYKNNYNIDLEKYSGRTDYLLAVPATYVIDEKGKIIFAYANEDYKIRPEPDQILNILREMDE